MKRLLAIMTLMCVTSAAADDRLKIVITVDGPKSNYAVTVNGKRAKYVLSALQELSVGTREHDAFFLIHEGVPFGVVLDLLGEMGKGGVVKPKMFVYLRDKDVMQEVSLGCVLLFSPDASNLTPAHGQEKCP